MKGTGNKNDGHIIDASMLEQDLNEKCARSFPQTQLKLTM